MSISRLLSTVEVTIVYNVARLIDAVCVRPTGFLKLLRSLQDIHTDELMGFTGLDTV